MKQMMGSIGSQAGLLWQDPRNEATRSGEPTSRRDPDRWPRRQPDDGELSPTRCLQAAVAEQGGHIPQGQNPRRVTLNKGKKKSKRKMQKKSRRKSRR